MPSPQIQSHCMSPTHCMSDSSDYYYSFLCKYNFLSPFQRVQGAREGQEKGRMHGYPYMKNAQVLCHMWTTDLSKQHFFNLSGYCCLCPFVFPTLLPFGGERGTPPSLFWGRETQTNMF